MDMLRKIVVFYLAVGGKNKPELLFDDGEIIERIKEHPMALWKINNAE